MTITITSKAFEPGSPIPVDHTVDGRDRSPPLAWSGVPAGAVELALVCDDPDAPTPSPWVHWVIYDMPAGTTSLPEGVPANKRLDEPPGAHHGLNSWSEIGYRGPAPPPGHGVHHYAFTLYALDTDLDLMPGLTRDELLGTIGDHVLATGRLIGTYQR